MRTGSLQSGPSEMGVHPTQRVGRQDLGPPGYHSIALMCDDIEADSWRVTGERERSAGGASEHAIAAGQSG